MTTQRLEFTEAPSEATLNAVADHLRERNFGVVIVATPAERINEHVFPYEDARLREQFGLGTKLARILILEQEFAPGRTTVVLVRQPIGV